MVFLVLLGDSVIYQFAVRTQFEGLRTYLKSIAQTAAKTINSEYLAEIPLTKEGINTQGYQIIAQQLKNIKAANPQIEFIYILTKGNSGRVWKFLVDIDEAMIVEEQYRLQRGRNFCDRGKVVNGFSRDGNLLLVREEAG